MRDSLLTKPRTRVSWSAEERAEWLHLFEQSGQTAADFCRDNDLSPATLSFWRQQVIEGPSTQSRLVEIPRETVSNAAAAPSSPPAVMVQLPSGLRFDVPVGIDAAWFGRLLQVFVDVRL